MDNMSSFGPGRILVVERDLAVSRYVEFVLGNWESFEVATVTEPAIALALLGNEPWDLVLVDFELPHTGVVDALGLLEAIREVEPGLPVAMLTAYPVLGATAEKLNAADGYVTKPITPSHLIGLATGLIERFRRAREQAAG
ncbi:MAG TPA: response regulator [Streptosporangiaceae bacterium]|jgi:DNA-binding response OmpR family regulator|nr:response regulator [Streptosporangiaceae bacterium]